jgi:hypothetical protein
MGLNVGSQATRRVPAAALFGSPPRDELPPPRQEGPQGCRLGLGAWPPRRPDRVGKVGECAGISGIGCGQLAGRFGKITRLAGVGYHHRQTRSGEGGYHRPLEAAGGLEPDERGVHPLELGSLAWQYWRLRPGRSSTPPWGVGQ